MAPSCASRTAAGAPGLASRSADLSTLRKMASTPLATSGDDSFAEKARSFWRMLDYCQWWVRRGKGEVRQL